MKRLCRRYGAFLIVMALLTACGGKEPETSANLLTTPSAASNGERNETEERDVGEDGGAEVSGQPGEEHAQPSGAADADVPGQMPETPGGQTTGLPEEQESEPLAASAGQEGNQVIKDLSSEEWEQIVQNGEILKFHDGDGGYVYVDPEAKLVYHQEIFAHERAEGSEVPYFHPHYSSRSDETMFAGSTDESGEQRYDVYVGEELLISGLSIDAEEMHKGDDGYIADYVLDVCYDAEEREVLLLTYHKNPKKKEEGFMIYYASEHDDCIQPLRFYPVLTGELYQELVTPDWIWSALLTPEAIYYDILPVKRIDAETGDVTEWGLTEAAYVETTGIENPTRRGDTKAAGGGYIMTVIKNPDPAFGDFTENTIDTYLIYTEDGELVYMIPDLHGGW